MSLLKQKTIKKEWDEKVLELNIDNNSKNYEIEEI